MFDTVVLLVPKFPGNFDRSKERESLSRVFVIGANLHHTSRTTVLLCVQYSLGIQLS